MYGLPLCAIQPSNTAKIGVVHGDAASPKAKPADIELRGLGTLACQISGSGPSGNRSWMIPSRFKPITTAKSPTTVGTNNGICPYIFPKSPLIVPKSTKARTIPLQKLKLRISGP